MSGTLTDKENEKFDLVGRVKTAGMLTDNTGAIFGFKMVDGKPQFSSMPYLYDIAEGNVANHSSWSKIGFSAGVGITERDIAPWMSAPYVFPSGALTMTIASDSSSDTKTSGTGAWTITIYYLTIAFVEKIVTIDMNGTGAVTVGTDVYRINNARVATAGTALAAVGNISIKSGAVTYGYISATKTRQRQMVWTVPAAKTLYVTHIEYSSSNQNPAKTGGARFTLRANYDEKSNLVLQRGLFMPFKESVLFNSTMVIPLSMPLKFPATTDLKVSVVSLVADTADVVCSLAGWTE